MSLRPGAAPPNGSDTKIIFLAGAVAYWWDENWDSPQHYEYMQWRNDVRTALVACEYLVYAHYEAFKGTWAHKAQSINEYALTHSDLMLILTAPEIPSPGTLSELLVAKTFGVPHAYAPSSIGLPNMLRLVATTLKGSS